VKNKTLDSVLRLFALIGNLKQGKGFSVMTSIIEMYLTSQFSKQTVESSLEILSIYIHDYNKIYKTNPDNWEFFFENELDAQCYMLSRDLDISQRLLVIIYTMEFLPYLLDVDIKSMRADENSSMFRLLSNIAQKMHIPQSDMDDCLAFIKESYQELSDNSSVCIITDNSSLLIPDVIIQFVKDLGGQIIFLWLQHVDRILFKVSGEANFEMGGSQIFKRQTYLMEMGSSLVVNDVNIFYFNDIARAIARRIHCLDLELEVHALEFHFKKGDWGIQPLYFKAESRELLAIMGASGSGKTTLMNLLTGFIKPQKGWVRLNGIDVSTYTQKVRSFIGYVPQEDALNEELTAFDNLYYTASLCLGNNKKQAIIEKIQKLLDVLDLIEIKDLRVGSPLDKVISGGQRKRLNIALELIRDPSVLFLDEPTSGLSSSDSENVIKILKQYALNGRLVVVNIHQPSSTIFKYFDHLLLLDKGGRTVYHGPAMRVNSYLKRVLQQADSQLSECHLCGNLNPEEIFQLVQKPKVALEGGYKPERQIKPERWHRHFLRVYFATHSEEENQIKELPVNELKLPGLLNQFYIQSKRNIKTKFADQLTFAISLLLPLFLAIILCYFSMNISDRIGRYVYSENQNIPAFVFMSVIVAIFIGLMSSSQEILKDRGTLRRETFLALNYFTYAGSKLSYLIVLSGLQMLLFTSVSMYMLEIPSDNGMFFYIMWATAVGSNAMGLFLSSVFKSPAAIYITIPLIIIPQILLAGAVINYDRINPSMTSHGAVPLAAQPMYSRWAYEGICVSLFINNEYSRLFYDCEQQISDASYVQNFLLSEMESRFFGDSETTSFKITQDSSSYELIKDGLFHLEKDYHYPAFPYVNERSIDGDEFQNYIDAVKTEASNRNTIAQGLKDSLIASLGNEKFSELKNMNHNKKLNEFLIQSDNVEKLIVADHHFIRKFNPVYDFGETSRKTPFFSPCRKWANIIISTPLNSIIMILIQMLFWFVLTCLKRVK
jgi:ABC-type multidrug transport system ATPase subunit